ncbi:uncharacterized protein B0I36DRAFT_364047 [Microdochium trichocladiopsis]|uniref:Uncharacterized protein n=1 Tax=Microdochium trichocladiopsis TaxID=1682393 RepID=A0A9P9BME0_9PEZI|nr:uncharacterized protein B0I36DRAFT_364047 [Microdochium trichocladiopsis]KAH7029513.1 hypothetical protein B0I36DRAFT_364047 [Microdochium trichocladiopsis]
MPRTTFTNTAEDPSITFELPNGPMTLYFHGNMPPDFQPADPVQGATPLVTSARDGPPAAAAAVAAAEKRRTGWNLLPVPQSDVAASVIPPGSHWAAAPHWHELHTEHFVVVRGFALVRIRGEYLVVGSSSSSSGSSKVAGSDNAGGVVVEDNGDDGRRRRTDTAAIAQTVLEIPPFTIHGFSRADVPGPAADRAWAEYESRNRGVPGAERHRYGAWREQDVVLFEWTSPSDGKKELFFRNMMSYFRDHLQPLLADILEPHPSSLRRRRQGENDNGAGLGAGLEGRRGGVSRGEWARSWPRAATSALRILVQIPPLVFSLAHLDNHMLLLDNRLGVKHDGGVSAVSLALSHGLNAVVKRVGGWFGWRSWWDEYTPVRLRTVAASLR